MGIFERYLSIWVALAIISGIFLGYLIPDIFQYIAYAEIAHVNLIVAILIWLMIYPMMIQIDWQALKDIGQKPKGLFLTLFVNWLVKPFTMALVGWLFFHVLFSAWINPQSAQQYIAGMILLGAAPCTAMVFVWSQLVKGDPNYTLVQVSVNDIIMLVAFTPIVGFLLGISQVVIPWATLIISTILYVLLPLSAGVVTRLWLQRKQKNISSFVALFRPFAIAGLILTVLILFGLQAETVVNHPVHILLIAIPLLLQTYGIFFFTHFLAKWLKLPYNIAAPACLIGTSNFFELAVAVAISLFGLHSGAALATVVGVLVEVPVMLSLVYWINKQQNQYL